MAEETTDANTGTEIAAGADSSSDTVDLQPIVGDDGLVSTVEYQTVEPEATTEDDIDSGDTSDGAEQSTPEDDPPEKKDFHEHPRFKELIDERNNLKSQIEALKNQPKPEKKPEQSTPTFKNIMEMDEDEISEEIVGNPKKFLANFAQQIAYELKSDLSAAEKQRAEQEKQLSVKERAIKTYQTFFDDKPDGQEMINTGKIQRFIDDNPGHNAISAYYALAGDNVIQAKIEAAVKEREKQIYKELKSAGRSKSVATQTGGRIINSDKSPEMKNPDKFGGRDSVLLKRLLQRQAS